MYEKIHDPLEDVVREFMTGGANFFCATRDHVDKCEKIPEALKDDSKKVKKWVKETADTFKNGGWQDIRTA